MTEDEIRAVKIGARVNPVCYPGLTVFEGEQYGVDGSPAFLRIIVRHTSQGWSFSVHQTGSEHSRDWRPAQTPQVAGFSSCDDVLQGVRDYLRACCAE